MERSASCPHFGRSLVGVSSEKFRRSPKNVRRNSERTPKKPPICLLAVAYMSPAVSCKLPLLVSPFYQGLLNKKDVAGWTRLWRFFSPSRSLWIWCSYSARYGIWLYGTIIGNRYGNRYRSLIRRFSCTRFNRPNMVIDASSSTPLSVNTFKVSTYYSKVYCHFSVI